MAKKRVFEMQFVSKKKDCPSAFPIDATTPKMKKNKKLHVKLCATPEMAQKLKKKHGG